MRFISIFTLTVILFLTGCTIKEETVISDLSERHIQKYNLLENIYDTENGYIQEIPNLEQGDLYTTYHTVSTLKILDKDILNRDKVNLELFLNNSLNDLEINDSRLTDKLYYLVQVYELLEIEPDKEKKDKILSLLSQLINELGEVFTNVGGEYSDISLIYQAIYIYDQFSAEIPNPILNLLDRYGSPEELYELLSLYQIYLILDIDVSTLVELIEEALHNNELNSNSDIMEIKLFFDLNKAIEDKSRSEELVTRVTNLKNIDGGWGIAAGTPSDVLSTHFAIEILSPHVSDSSKTISLINTPSTTGGYTHIISGEADITSNYYFTSINKILKKKNQSQKNIIQFTNNSLKENLNSLSPFDLYILLKTLDTDVNNLNDNFTEEIKRYVKIIEEVSPVQLFYLSKINCFFTFDEDEKIKRLMKEQNQFFMDAGNSSEKEETIKVFRDLINSNLMCNKSKSLSKINLEDYEEQKILSEIKNNHDLMQIFISELNWSKTPNQLEFLKTTLEEYDELLDSRFSSQIFYEFLMIYDIINELE